MEGAPVPFERFAAGKLREQREEIARAWISRIPEEPRVRPRHDLPAAAPLRAFPEVLGKVADFLCSDDERTLSDDPVVVEALRGLARERQSQGYDVQELIRELHLLARDLDEACLEWLDAYPSAPAPAAVVRVTGRLNRAPLLLGEITAGAFLEMERAEQTRLAEQMETFAAMLVHELKNPLHTAATAAVILESEEMVPTAQDRRRYAGLIQRSLHRANTLIGDVRGLALFSQAAGSDPSRRLPVGQVLGAVLAQVRELTMAAGVEVEVEEPAPPVWADAARLELILLNLIGNAAKYSDPTKGSRWVRVRFGPGGALGDDAWWVEVSDNGLGIPAEDRARVFERFFRAHPKQADGMGLGLTIVREAVRQLGGTIEFDSEQGRGTTFRVTLPAPAGDQENA